MKNGWRVLASVYMKPSLIKLLSSIIFCICINGTARAHTIISSHVSAVCIVMVDSRNNITDIYTNTTQPIAPTFKSDTGQSLPPTPQLQQSYKKTFSAVPTTRIGHIYHRSDSWWLRIWIGVTTTFLQR